MERLKCQGFAVDGKWVEVYPSPGPNCPVIYLNAYAGEGGSVLQALEALECPGFSLVAISGLAWNHDMAPWDIPPISRDGTACTGGADAYLRLLTEKIMPTAGKMLPGTPAWQGLAGYSLAGLFALYAMYRSCLFSRFASISGSLWFPGFKEYAMSHEPERWPDCLYLSLGDTECRTKNACLKPVQSNTEALAAFYRGQQINTEFQLNPGNHFTENIKRSALGIRWLLTE